MAPKIDVIVGDLPTTRLHQKLGCPFDDQDPRTPLWMLGFVQAVDLIEKHTRASHVRG